MGQKQPLLHAKVLQVLSLGGWAGTKQYEDPPPLGLGTCCPPNTPWRVGTTQPFPWLWGSNGDSQWTGLQFTFVIWCLSRVQHEIDLSLKGQQHGARNRSNPHP